MDALINYGFIKQIRSGVPTMSVSIYGYSHRWKYYGTDAFYIPNEDKRYKRKPKKVLVDDNNIKDAHFCTY